MRQPLVSVITPNYNHSRFLDACIKSVLNQTYGNIEHIVLDNQSSDNSVDVVKKYVDKGVRICRNPYNYLNLSYRVLANLLLSEKSEYLMLLPADDYIMPSFIEKCVGIMEEYHNVGYVHVERDFIKANGELIELDPFYDRSFIAPGKNVMPIYMMTTVAHPGQGIFRRDVFKEVGGYNRVVSHTNADKSLWFYLSEISDYAYIREKLSRIRIGDNTETLITQKNFQHPILMYMTLKEFVDYSEFWKLPEVKAREREAFYKLAVEFLDHAAGIMLEGGFVLARQYLAFCEMMSDNIVYHEHYKKLNEMYETRITDEKYLRASITLQAGRKRSYAPPEGYKEVFATYKMIEEDESNVR